MTKTDKMLLIEERAGTSIEQVMFDAYHEGQTVEKAAEVIQSRFGVPMSAGVFHDWVQASDAVIRKEIVFPHFTPERHRATESAALVPETAAA